MTPYLDKGLEVVAMLPRDLQNYSNLEGVVLSRTKSADAAAAFLRYITSPAARELFAKMGVD
jgi:ABC-type molybdate transport system substrate-binding protein